MSFFSKLNAAIETNHSLLCVGLDPVEANLLPGTDIGTRLVDWAGKLIEQTGDLVCCYKPNIAFYEQFGLKGLKALQDTLALIPQTIPVILDAKRGDIGSTAEAYATAVFEQWGADAVTLSPYLGEDSVAPFLARQGKAIFLLCHTSNPSAGQIQLHGKPPLYQWIAQTAQSWGSDDQIGFVVGATQPEALQHVRSICPSNWILAPGVGAQGGDLDQALSAGLRADGRGLIIPVSRGCCWQMTRVWQHRHCRNASMQQWRHSRLHHALKFLEMTSLSGRCLKQHASVLGNSPWLQASNPRYILT